MAVTQTKVPFKFYLSADLAQGMRDAAERLDRTMTSVVSQACSEFLQSNGPAASSPEKRSRAAKQRRV